MILFVDDEQKRMESFVEELEFEGYEVEFKSDVDSAMEFFEENGQSVEVIILDVMMPAGRVFEGVDTAFGTRTGIRFYKKIREKNQTIPIILFTNISDESVIEEIGQNSKSLFLEKENFLPFEFVYKVKNILQSENLEIKY